VPSLLLSMEDDWRSAEAGRTLNPSQTTSTHGPNDQQARSAPAGIASSTPVGGDSSAVSKPGKQNEDVAAPSDSVSSLNEGTDANEACGLGVNVVGSVSQTLSPSGPRLQLRPSRPLDSRQSRQTLQNQTSDIAFWNRSLASTQRWWNDHEHPSQQISRPAPPHDEQKSSLSSLPGCWTTQTVSHHTLPDRFTIQLWVTNLRV